MRKEETFFFEFNVGNTNTFRHDFLSSSDYVFLNIMSFLFFCMLKDGKTKVHMLSYRGGVSGGLALNRRIQATYELIECALKTPDSETGCLLKDYN